MSHFHLQQAVLIIYQYGCWWYSRPVRFTSVHLYRNNTTLINCKTGKKHHFPTNKQMGSCINFTVKYFHYVQGGCLYISQGVGFMIKVPLRVGSSDTTTFRTRQGIGGDKIVCICDWWTVQKTSLRNRTMHLDKLKSPGIP